jgi:hypothetical protein
MTLIHVPRPAKSALDPNRPVNALLKTQVEHLNEAEKRLPLRYHTDTYVNAIKTEGEAAHYIGQVTEAIHKAHEDAAKQRATPQRKRKRTTSSRSGKRKPRGKNTKRKPQTRKAT